MRTIHYSIRMALVLIIIALFYLSVTAVFHQTIQIPVVLTLLLIWALLAWLSPIIGRVDTKEQTHLVEDELARSQRYNSHLVVAAIREKKRTPLHIVAQNLRTTDSVLRSPAGYLLVLMPGITLEQAEQPLKRMGTTLSIKDIIVADEKMLQTIVKTQSANLNGDMSNVSAAEFRKICMQAFDAKCASIKASTHENENDAPDIHSLLDLQQAQNLPDRKIFS